MSTTGNKKTYTINLEAIKQADFAEKYNQKDDYIWWGKKNDFPEVLIQLLNNSALHHNIVEKRAGMIMGTGIEVDKSSNKNLILTETFLKSVNRYGETMQEVLEKIALDFVVFNSAAVQVLWGKFTEDQTTGFKIAEILHMPMDKIRFGKRDKLGNINTYFYSDNWARCKQDEFKPIPISTFSTVPERIKADPTQILVLNKYSVGDLYYSKPDYCGGLNYIHLDFQTSEFATNYVRNGYFPNVMVTFKNISEDDKEFVTDSFKANYTGATNTNKVLYNFTEGENDVKIEPINIQGFEQVITVFNKLTTENILQAHGIGGVLVGIETAGKLGDTHEINNSYLMYESSKTQPAQQFILGKINKLLKINDLDEITVTSSTPIPFQVNETVMEDVLTVNELREQMGFGDLDLNEYGNIVTNVIGGKAPIAPVATIPQVKQKKLLKPKAK